MDYCIHCQDTEKEICIQAVENWVTHSTESCTRLASCTALS